MSITDYGKAKLEVVEKSKNKKHRRTYEPRGLDVVPWGKKLETQRPWYTTLRQSKANFDKPNGRERDRSMEERYVDGRHIDRWRKHNSYVGWLELILSKR